MKLDVCSSELAESKLKSVELYIQSSHAQAFRVRATIAAQRRQYVKTARRCREVLVASCSISECQYVILENVMGLKKLKNGKGFVGESKNVHRVPESTTVITITYRST
jgi:tRNA(Ile2) C34 agmatinyltransferase TiaS